MNTSKAEFDVQAPRDTIFALSGDLEELGFLVPSVTKVDINDVNDAVWDLTVKLGLLKVHVLLRTVITELDGPSLAKFTGEAEVLDMNGVVELTDIDGGTHVELTLETEAKGPLKNMINTYMEPKLKEYCDGFAENLRAKLAAE